MKYVCLLRGINVGGKNAAKMSELKACFEEIGLKDVSTYINSGNVLFETAKRNDAELVRTCRAAFQAHLGFSVPLAVISHDELKDALDFAPTWWNNTSTDKNNVIFVIAPATAKQVMEKVGPAKPECEQVAARGPVIFWTTTFKDFGKTRYSKIVGSSAYQDITIRNANTTGRLLELLEAA